MSSSPEITRMFGEGIRSAAEVERVRPGLTLPVTAAGAAGVGGFGSSGVGGTSLDEQESAWTV